MLIKTSEEKKILKEAGRRLAIILSAITQVVKPGVTTDMLDEIAERLIRNRGDIPAFKNYTPEGAEYPYPATLCVSVNNEVVHGIPSSRVLKDGDIVGLDIGLTHNGLIVDMAETVPVGKIDGNARKLIEVTRGALGEGIAAARTGGTTGDIGNAIESYVKEFGDGYGIIRELGGHGVGKHVHEKPFIHNFGKRGEGERLKDGMVIALEPMINEGSENVILKDDGYTFITKDGSRSAHFEHTIIVGKEGGEVITKK